MYQKSDGDYLMKLRSKSAGLKHLCTQNCSICFNFCFHLFQLCCTSLQTLTFQCTSAHKGSEESFLPIQMVQQNEEGYKLNWLLTASLFQSKVFHPALFWRSMHHCQLPSKFPVLSHLEVDLIDVDPWHQFFSDSLGLIKVTSCCLKWTWWGEIHQLCTFVTSFTNSSVFRVHAED